MAGRLRFLRSGASRGKGARPVRLLGRIVVLAVYSYSSKVIHVEVADLSDVVVSAKGPIQKAVIASGIIRRGLPEDCIEADGDQGSAANLKGCFLCCQAVGRHMPAVGGYLAQ